MNVYTSFLGTCLLDEAGETDHSEVSRITRGF